MSTPVPNLLVGYDTADDCAVYRLRDDLVMAQTLDFFPPLVDDPYQFGAIAAANALSDIYAMGGEPKICLNIACFPEDLDPASCREILRGGYEKALEAGAVVAGGHTVHAPEPKYGMTVTAFMRPEEVVTNEGARPGDVLFYTKPLGIGVVTTGMKVGMVAEETIAAAIQSMMTLNKAGRDIMVRHGVHAATDVTGFGLMGHLYEMVKSGSLAVELDSRAFSFLPESLSLAKMGILPAGMYHNLEIVEGKVDHGSVDQAVRDLLYDPQTSGGLLFAVAEEEAEACLRDLQAHPQIPAARQVGRFVEEEGETRIRLI